MLFGRAAFRRVDVRRLGADHGVEWKRDALEAEDISACSAEHEKNLRMLTELVPELLDRARRVCVVTVRRYVTLVRSDDRVEDFRVNACPVV